MNTKVLLLGAVVAALAITTLSAGPLLTPRAASNQSKSVNISRQAAAVTVRCVDANTALLTPRAASNLSKVVQSASNDINPARACQKSMGGSPKAVAECTSHTTMPGCAAVAMNK